MFDVVAARNRLPQGSCLLPDNGPLCAAPTASSRSSSSSVAAGAQALAAPVTKPWGQTVAYVRCPDGTLVELCTAMG